MSLFWILMEKLLMEVIYGCNGFNFIVKDGDNYYKVTLRNPKALLINELTVQRILRQGYWEEFPSVDEDKLSEIRKVINTNTVDFLNAFGDYD